MSHFFAGIQGQAGDATRRGSKDSGIGGYVQSEYSRLTVDMRHIGRRSDDHSGGLFTSDNDRATFTIGPGRSSYTRSRSVSFNPNDVAAALDLRDARIERIWDKIDKAFRELDAQAPIAIDRAAKRVKREKAKAEKERKIHQKMQAEVIATMTPEVKARIVKLVPHVELDDKGEFDEHCRFDLCRTDTIDLRRGDDDRVYINAGTDTGGYRFPFDLTTGQWVLPFDPADLGLTTKGLHGYGWREEKVAA